MEVPKIIHLNMVNNRFLLCAGVRDVFLFYYMFGYQTNDPKDLRVCQEHRASKNLQKPLPSINVVIVPLSLAF